MTTSKSIIIKTEYVYDFLLGKKYKIKKEIDEQLKFEIESKVVMLYKNNPSDFKVVIWTKKNNLSKQATIEKISRIIEACLGEQIISISWDDV
jgi:hypothetical protein